MGAPCSGVAALELSTGAPRVSDCAHLALARGLGCGGWQTGTAVTLEPTRHGKAAGVREAQSATPVCLAPMWRLR